MLIAPESIIPSWRTWTNRILRQNWKFAFCNQFASVNCFFSIFVLRSLYYHLTSCSLIYTLNRYSLTLIVIPPLHYYSLSLCKNCRMPLILDTFTIFFFLSPTRFEWKILRFLRKKNVSPWIFKALFHFLLIVILQWNSLTTLVF